MAVNFGYVKLPAYQTPDGLDQKTVNGLSNALTQIGKFRNQNVELDQQQQKIDLAKNQDFRSGETHAQGQEDNKIKSLALQALRIKDLSPDDPRRMPATQTLFNSHPSFKPLLQKYGQDPDKNPDGALDFFIAQAGLYKGKDTLEKERLEREHKGKQGNLLDAQAEYLRGAKSDLAQAQAEAALKRGAGRMMDAETRRRKAIDDWGALHGGDPEKWKREDYERESQEGGLIHTAFGGKVPEFADRERFLHYIQARKEAKNDKELELIDQLGPNATADTAKWIRQQQTLTKMMGKAPEKGFEWIVESDGKVRQQKLADSNRPGEIPVPQLEMQRDGLQEAFRVLVGTRNPDGTLRKDGPSSTMRFIANTDTGNFLNVNPKIKEAYQRIEHGALTASYALSGKQVGQKEQENIKRIFSPAPFVDGPEIHAFKINELMTLYNRLIEAKKAGKTGTARGKLFDSEVSRSARELEKLEEKLNKGQPVQPPGQKAAPKATRSPGATTPISDEELLRELNK